LVLNSHITINSGIHHIIPVGAKAFGAINITILGIANAGTSLLVVPLIQAKGLNVLDKLTLLVTIERRVSITKRLNVLAGTVTRAIIGAGGSLASFAFVSLEALALTGLTVADSLVGTFSILVEIIVAIRCINPGKFEGADTVRAITSV